MIVLRNEREIKGESVILCAETTITVSFSTSVSQSIVGVVYVNSSVSTAL